MSRHSSPATSGRRVLLSPSRADMADAGLLTLLTCLALIGFRTTYTGWVYFVAGIAGLVLGIAIAHLANVLRQPMIAVAAMAIGVFFLLGGAIALRSTAVAGVLPSGATLHGLADESVHGWKDLLTTLPPVDGTGPLLVLPYIMGLLCGAGGFCLARRTRPAFAPVAAPLAVLVAVILLGTQTSGLRTLQSALFVVIALAWAALRGQRLRPALQNGSGRAMRAATAAGLLAGAGVGAFVVGPHVPGVGSHQRLVLRTYVQPPFDIGQYPSPLAGFRKYTKPAKQLYNKPLFTVTGLPAGTNRVRIATLDDYNSTVWAASNNGNVVAGRPDTFQRVGPTIDDPAAGQKASLTVTIDSGYSDYWLPVAGTVAGVQFDGSHAHSHQGYFRYNLATGTGVVPDKLEPGDQFTEQTVLPATTDLTATDAVANIGTVPDSESSFLGAQAKQWSGSANSATARIFALAQHLYTTGKFSDGAPPNQQYLPGHSQWRLLTFVNGPQIVGDDEQYAAAFALMVNQLGVPARVVVGAVPEAGGVVKGQDVHAWVEVQLADSSWRTIPQTVFMNVNSAPTKQPPQQQQELAGQVVPPPVTIPPRSSLNDANLANSKSQHNVKNTPTARAGFHLPWIVGFAAKWVGTPLLVIVLICALIIGIKARRRKLRRTRGTPAMRLARGWREIVDQARDLGTVMPAGRTRREQGAVLDHLGVAQLARTADAHVFGPEEPQDQAAAEYWAEVNGARRQMASKLGRWRRIRAAVSLVSLRRPHGLAAEVEA